MFKSALVTLALAGGLFAAAPASAMPVAPNLGEQVGSGVSQVALYCNNRGQCVSYRRQGYYYRAGPPVVYRAPVYRAPVYARPAYRAPVNRTVTTKRVVRPNGNTTVKKTVRTY